MSDVIISHLPDFCWNLYVILLLLSDDEDKYAEQMDMPGQKFETKQRITVRNLRIREDTAKVCVLAILR